MKEKIINWLEKHKYVYAVILVFASLCMVAFGFANLGEDMLEDDVITGVNLHSEETDEEFTAE